MSDSARGAFVLACVALGFLLSGVAAGAPVGPADVSVATQDPSGVAIDDRLNGTTGEQAVLVGFDDSGDALAGSGNGSTDASVGASQARAASTGEPLRRFAARTPGVTVERQFWITDAALVRVDTDRVPLDILARVAGVAWLEPNAEVRAHAGASTATSGQATAAPTASTRAQGVDNTKLEGAGVGTTDGLAQIRAPTAWERYGTRGAGATVAVLDSGVDATHPDIDLARWAEFNESGGRVGSEPRDIDPRGHGTHVSGTATGGAASGTHIGVAPAADLYHGAVLTDCSGPSCSGSVAQILAGMEWAVAHDADVLSMSLGARGLRPRFVEPIRNAEAAGTVVVASSGNSGPLSSNSPGNVYDSIAVGAATDSRQIAPFSGGEEITTSEWGSFAPDDWPAEYVVPTVSAPGAGVTSAEPDDAYGTKDGTSMAAPHVSGAVALLQAATARPVAPDTIETALVATAQKPASVSTPAGLRDVRYGAGIIDVPAAIDALITTTASFALRPSTPAAGQNVTLAASVSTGDIARYEWDLTGDGTVDATGRNVTHAFPTTGTYNVTLTVVGANGTTDTAVQRVPVRERWAIDTGSGVQSSPTVVNDTVFVGNDAGNVSALDAATGAREWRVETGGPVETAPTVVGVSAGRDDAGTVYVGSRDGRVYALDAATGTEVWAFETGGAVQSSPTVAGGTVYVGSDDSRVYALDAATGTVDWQVRTGGPVRSSPTVAAVSSNSTNRTVFVGSNDRTLYALDAATGAKRWTFETLSQVTIAPTVANISRGGQASGWTVYASSRNDDVYALNATTGQKRWAYQTRSLALSSPTVAGGDTETVFLALTSGGNGVLTALNASTGERRWRFSASDLVLSAPTVAGVAADEGTVFVGSGDSFVTQDTSIYAVDAATGERRWRYRTGGAVRSSPTVATVGTDPGGTVFVGSDDGYLYALDSGVLGASTGSRVRRGTLGHTGAWARQVPTALFTLTPARPDEPFDLLPGESVTLDAGPSSGTITSYEWDRGTDGTVDATGETANVSFERTGRYEVRLTVTTASGETASTTRTLSVNDPTTTERWTADTGSAVDASPTVVDSAGGNLSANATAFVGNRNGTVAALDAATGEQRWTFETGGAVEGAPTVVSGVAFVGSQDGRVYALNATTGDRRWTVEAGGPVRSGPTVAGGTVYVGSDSDSVVALNAATGQEQWTVETDGPVRAAPTVAGVSNNPAAPADETVFVGSTDGSVAALDAATGQERWAFDTGGSVLSSPTVGGSNNTTVYVGSLDGSLYALDAVTGAREWRFETAGPVWSSPTVAAPGTNETVFVGSSDDRLYAVDGDSGEVRWRFDTGSSVRSSPTVAGLAAETRPATVYAGTTGGTVYAIAAETGRFRWRSATGGPVESSPTVARVPALSTANATVYVGSANGTIAALDAEVGSPSAGSRVRLGTLGHTGAWADQPPVARFGVAPTIPTVGSETVFDAAPSFGRIVSYEWDIVGDNTTDATGRTVSFSFERAGSYDVVLIVTGVDGETGTTTRTVTVERVPALVGDRVPKDLDGDGLYEAIRGGTELTVLDVQALFNNLDNPAVQENSVLFNFSGLGSEVTVLDVQALFNGVEA